ncbi:PTS sugar transporter subunit IIA [Calorimonas adulescens]|jgi:Phosphoenolpyruvate-dependent sugar phosphotransferase system, EIIA 2.|uniref:Mannitol-specific phosphotransferase enzyme IIA component n=1 Tax=Calorimonas adulescens TaxID=2606906 RepID=A0A5D8QEL1_9THEO|nr:PTS sugar transporter subunit IIA [Calorimonas adulescens]TZE82941.1 PTS sugar transporter subunit IIA [Calorimonas adulescens]
MEVLTADNVMLGLPSEERFEAIKRVGKKLVENGYVEEQYIEGMIKREEDISTYIGNGVAIPHAVSEYVKYIKGSGIVIAQYPQGVDFGAGKAYLVIGIAGKGDEHMNILSKIAIVCSEIDNVKKLVSAKDPEEVINTIEREVL